MKGTIRSEQHNFSAPKDLLKIDPLSSKISKLRSINTEEVFNKKYENHTEITKRGIDTSALHSTGQTKQHDECVSVCEYRHMVRYTDHLRNIILVLSR